MKKTIKLNTAVFILALALAGCSSGNAPAQSSSQQTNAPAQNQTTTVSNTKTQNKISSTANSATSDSPAETSNSKSGVQTPRGVVWLSSPKMNSNGSAVPSPLTPFSLYLSPNNNQLQTSSAEKILTLPLTENTPAGQFYVYLSDYFYSDNWIVYSIYLMKPGMAQAYSDQLRAVNLDNKKDILLTDFHESGGYLFSVAADNNLILFSQKSPGPGATYLKQVYMFNLDNGQKESVAPKDLKVIPEKNTLEYSKDGQTMTFQLRLKDSGMFSFE